jgi:predicted membrane protein
LLNWKTLLIGIGLYSGAKRNFAGPYGWLIPIALGVVFLAGDILHMDLIKYIVPIVLIGVGFVMILNATGRSNFLRELDFTNKNNTNPNTTDADAINATYTNSQTDAYTNANYNEHNTVQLNSMFSGSKQIVTHKNFKGGSVNAVMGGAEIDLMQADISEPAIIDVMILMGGLKLIVPPTWEVKTEVGCLFGGVEDKRPRMLADNNAIRKVLLIKGTTVMGGVDIRTY